MTRIIKAPPQSSRADGSIAGGWWHATDGDSRIVCDLCPRACSLKPGDRGFCFVRENVEGQMVLSTYGRSTGFCVDPIEKKPLNHFLPGTAVLSFGTAGCNLGCKFCQNWDISKSREVALASEVADPETIAAAAAQLGCHSVAFTYNDPVIWAEYAVDTARACHDRDVRTVAVTAGYIAPEARAYFFSEMDAANVDLKAFGDAFYRQLTYSQLQPVLDTLVWLKQETNVWFEITNLMIPRENDSRDEVRRMCAWIAENLGDDVPLHFTAFHPDFRMRDRPATPRETLLQAYDQAKSQGLKYVYVGNVHDPVHDSTYCPYCDALLIERNWHELGAYHLKENRCHRCDKVIAGRFLDQPGTWGRRRQPIRIADFAEQRHDPGTRDAPKATGSASRPASRTGAAPQDDSAAAPQLSNGATPMSANPTEHLTQRQQDLVFQATCEFVVAGIEDRPAVLADPTLGGAADTSVMGAFVTLKRRDHLRACCGSLGHPMSLIDAVRGAAVRTATDDQRLPPISMTELPHLDVDVSLLHNFRVIAATGADRSNEIELGQHGLTIQQGQSGGLLLPNVAVENHWDRPTFLRQICRKAGLPLHAWREDDAKLQTFETLVIEGTFAERLLAHLPATVPALLTSEELEALDQHCRTNVLALLEGATPNYYVPSCQDATAQGVLLALEVPPHGARAQFARMSLRPGLPLQSTLFQLCEVAVSWLRSVRPNAAELSSLSAHVTVLHDSATHGTVADPDLRGLTPRHRVLVAAQHGRFAWSYAPDEPPERLLTSAATGAQVLDARTASLFSLAVDTQQSEFQVNMVPNPVAGPAVREPAVAGTFYPSEKQALESLVEQLIEGTSCSDRKPYPAIMVPHAGLRFSGRIAAATYQHVTIPERVLILAPKHTRAGTPWAVAPHSTWSLPGTTIDSAPDLARRLANTIPYLNLDAAAHRDEHAIEVQLPLLARLAPTSQVVGITIGEGDLQACTRFADHLADVLRDDSEPPLLVISTDLNHYAPDAENRRIDQIALDALLQCNPDLLFETVRKHDISMCGLLPAVIVLRTLHNLGTLSTCTQVAYGTSADAGGSADRVVGYAGMLFA